MSLTSVYLKWTNNAKSVIGKLKLFIKTHEINKYILEAPSMPIVC